MSTLLEKIKVVDLNNKKQYRIIPSVYPPINFFEDLVDPSEMGILFEIENMTNDRLRQEVGDIFLVSKEDRISGQGSSVVMAAFTHIGKPSRFTDGTYGIYYAGLSLETAIRETVFRREIFLRSTNQSAGHVTMRVYEGNIIKPLHDVRNPRFIDLHYSDNFLTSQNFGREMRNNQSWGLIYNSVRHPGGNCIAAFRPPTISIPRQTMHLKYHWDSEKIYAVSSTEILLKFE
jgi:hypothetical protein